MTKTQFYMARRGPTVSVEGFPQRWCEHFALYKTFDAPQAATPFTSGRYLLVDHALSDARTDTAPFDAVCIMTIEDVSLIGASRRDEAMMRVMKADEAVVFGGDIDPAICLGERRTLVEGKRRGHAVILLRQRRPAVTPAAFEQAWLDHMQGLLASPAVAGRPRLTTHTSVEQVRSAEYAYDGMTEIWLETPDDVKAVIGAVIDPHRAEAEAAWAIPARSRNMATKVLPRS
jgi:hypothetical protein